MPMSNKCWKKSLQNNSLLQIVEINKLPVQLPYLILLLHAVQIVGLYSRFYVQSNTEVPTFPIFWNFHRFFYKQFTFLQNKRWVGSLSTNKDALLLRTGQLTLPLRISLVCVESHGKTSETANAVKKRSIFMMSPNSLKILWCIIN